MGTTPGNRGSAGSRPNEPYRGNYAQQQAQYQQDLQNVRAPTATGTAPTTASWAATPDINGVPQIPALYMGDPSAGPGIPAPLVMPTAPSRNTLAGLMRRQPAYVGGRGGDRSSSGYSGSASGGRGGFGGSSARSGGLY